MRKSSVIKTMLAATCSAVALTSVSQAFAQSTDEIETIVVTANRRNENAQKVPIAVAAVTADLVKQMDIGDPRALASLVPGLQIDRIGIFPATFLRGVGTTSSGPTIETAVATYIDDVYMPSSASSALSNYSNLFIERIEVEKGPQGTLFGRNATGGVIQIFTKDPAPTPALDASIGYANYNTPSGALYMTGALSSKLSANIALYASKQYDGWGHNLLTGTSVNRSYDYGGRIKFLLTPSDQTSFLLTFDYDRTWSDFATVNRPAYGTKNVSGFLPPANYFDANLDQDTFNVNRQEGVSLKIKHDLDWAKLVSITSYRSNFGIVWYDNDYGPATFSSTHPLYPEKTWTQEVQLLSPDSSPLTWIVGFYYFGDEGGVNPNISWGTVLGPRIQYVQSFTNQSTKSYAGYGQATAEILPNTHLTAGLRYTVDQRSLVDSFVIKNVGAPPSARSPVANSPQSKQWGAVSGRVAIDHQFTDDIMGYIAYNKGFRSGLFNPQLAAGAPIGAAVNPEKMDAFTIGTKEDFLDHRLRVNVEGFYYLIKNLQLAQTVAASTLIVNAAAATMKGIDLDVTAKPIENLTLLGSFELMQGKYDSYPNGLFNVYNPNGGNCTFTVVPGGPAPCGGRALPPNYNRATGTWNLAGNDTVHTPSFSFTLTANYVFHTEMGLIDTNLSWDHTSSYFADGDNGLGQVFPSSLNNDKQKVLDLVNGSVGWGSQDGRWEVRAWARNLTDVHYWANTVENAQATRNNVAAPRTYGLTLTTHL